MTTKEPRQPRPYRPPTSAAELLQRYAAGERYFLGARLCQAQLANADLRQANLARADLQGATLTGANLSGASLLDAKLQHAVLDGADLSGASLFSARLRGASLVGARLYHTVLSDAHLELSVFSRADLSGADLSGAVLDEASFVEARLSGANARRARFRAADLSEADIGGADLAGATIEGANLSNVQNWKGVTSLAGTNLYGIENEPDGFFLWAMNEASASYVEPKDGWHPEYSDWRPPGGSNRQYELVDEARCAFGGSWPTESGMDGDGRLWTVCRLDAGEIVLSAGDGAESADVFETGHHGELLAVRRFEPDYEFEDWLSATDAQISAFNRDYTPRNAEPGTLRVVMADDESLRFRYRTSLGEEVTGFIPRGTDD